VLAERLNGLIDCEHDTRVRIDPPGQGVETADHDRRMALERFPATLGFIVTINVKMQFHASTLSSAQVYPTGLISGTRSGGTAANKLHSKMRLLAIACGGACKACVNRWESGRKAEIDS